MKRATAAAVEWAKVLGLAAAVLGLALGIAHAYRAARDAAPTWAPSSKNPGQ